MKLIDRTGRLTLSAMFLLVGGLVVRNPAKQAATARQLLAAVRKRLPVPVPNDELAVRLNAGVQVAAALGLAFDVAPRVCSGILLGSLVPVTIAGHSFWTVDEPAQRFNHRVHFLKNVGVSSGLLLVLASPLAER
jgi:putative oxidoreductase